jgi:hypothetical protein
MIRTQASLDKDLYRAARAEAKRRAISFAELCRRALARIVAPSGGREEPWMRYLGCLDSEREQESRRRPEAEASSGSRRRGSERSGERIITWGSRARRSYPDRAPCSGPGGGDEEHEDCKPT